jgi:hypothetical protein
VSEYKANMLPRGACEITCGDCGEKYTASAGEVEAIGWLSHHTWACPKNESLKGVVEVVPIKFESFSIGGEVAPKCPTCSGPLLDLRGAGFNPDAVEKQGQCYRWTEKDYCCAFTASGR